MLSVAVDLLLEHFCRVETNLTPDNKAAAHITCKTFGELAP